MDLLRNCQTYWTDKFGNLDERVADLPLVASSYQVPLIIFAYVYFVLVCGPKFMKNRSPYSLKTFIQLYNIVQIVANALLVYEFLDAGLFTRSQLFLCPVLDFSYNETPMRLTKCAWYYMMLKILDYAETMFFILRKKNNQVSILHLYHHISTLFITWLLVRYLATAPALFSPMLNTVIHVIMYMYYFLAACGENIQKVIAKWKHYITILQMVQFIMMLLYVSQNLIPRCNCISYVLSSTIQANIVMNFYLFYNFYKKAYKKSNKKTQ